MINLQERGKKEEKRREERKICEDREGRKSKRVKRQH